jgi:hypothetical protein
VKIRRILSILTVSALVLFCSALAFAPAPPAHAQQYGDCFVTGASPLNCQSAGSGIVSVAAGATTAVINTAAVAPGARIFLTQDSSTTTGTLLGVTCNTTADDSWVSAKSNGLSFTITVASAPTTNPACYMFQISGQ